MKLNELPPKTLIKQAHAGVKLIAEQYPEAAAILREAITRFDVLREVHQLAKQEAQPVIPIGLVPAINRLLDSDGSRGRFSAMELYDARKDLELLLASAAQPVSEPYKLPAGWKLVPEEATIAMLTILGLTGSFDFMQQKYKNMLAASPSQESE